MKNKFLISITAMIFLFQATAFCKDSIHEAAYNGDIESVKKIFFCSGFLVFAKLCMFY